MKKALILTSFGTSVPEAGESIAALEEVLRRAAPGWTCVRAFTSPTVRRILAGRGERIPSLSEALSALSGDGYTYAAVQPTHVICGEEYDRITACAAKFSAADGSGLCVRTGRPLLAGNGDVRRLARVLADAYPPRPGEVSIFFGHGTAHAADIVYPALQTAFRLCGREDLFVGTVEGWPALEEVSAELPEGKRVRLIPLMLTAGEHVRKDMAGGGPDSWKSRLTGMGHAVDCVFTGLGLLPGIQEMYREHLLALLSSFEREKTGRE